MRISVCVCVIFFFLIEKEQMVYLTIRKGKMSVLFCYTIFDMFCCTKSMFEEADESINE